jgi:transposase-like protein
MSKQAGKRSGNGRSRAQWQRLLAAYDQRTVTRREFCAQAGVSPSTLDYWRRKLRDEGSARAGFIELAGGEDGRSRWEVELALGDGVVLRLARR